MNLKITQFGNPILRQNTKKLSQAAIASSEVQQLIDDMTDLLIKKKLGVGLAAPQVGSNYALSVIELSASTLRDAEPISLVIINPEILQTYGYRKQMWEGCISGGPGKAGMFAKVPRYRKIQVRYSDRNGVEHTETFQGLVAHIIQHEVDRLNGILFVDKVKDTTTYMTYSEYKKIVKTL